MKCTKEVRKIEESLLIDHEPLEILSADDTVPYGQDLVTDQVMEAVENDSEVEDLIDLDDTVAYMETPDVEQFPDLIDFDSDALEQDVTVLNDNGADMSCDTPNGSSESEGGSDDDEDDEPEIEIYNGELPDDLMQVEVEDPGNVGPAAEEASLSEEFFTPAESPANLSSASSAEEADDPRPAVPCRRAQRQRRARNYLTYPKLGEPRISRYTMMAVESKPPRIFEP